MHVDSGFAGSSHALRIGASLVTVPVLGMGLEVCRFLRLLCTSWRCIAAAVNDMYDNVLSVAYRALISETIESSDLGSMCNAGRGRAMTW